MRIKTFIIISATLLLIILPSDSFSDQNRRALVIGNDAYEDAPLRNPVNDAKSIADVLQKLGFSVMARTNVTQEELEDAIRAFGRSLYPEDIGLFYFSGHGVQVDGVNYLLPIGARIVREHEIKYKAVNSQMILEEMLHSRCSLNIIVLDACRNNPFRGFRSIRRGLATMSPPSVPEGGTLIAYATAPDTVALDGEGKNSPYAKHLVHAMSVPGLEIEQVFKRVRVAVKGETDNRQVPWESSSLTRDFFFKPVATAPPRRDPEEIARPEPRPAQQTMSTPVPLPGPMAKPNQGVQLAPRPPAQPQRPQETSALPDTQPTGLLTRRAKVCCDEDGWVNVRQGPGKQHNVVDTVEVGRMVVLRQKAGEWWKIEAPLEGYIHENRLEIMLPSPESMIAQICCDDDGWVSVRDGPGDEHDTIGTLEVGAIVSIRKKEGEWLSIDVPVEGYVHKGHVQGLKPQPK